jgi:hypothetical protein
MTIGEEERNTQQQPADPSDEQPAPACAHDQQGEATSGHAGEQTVRRYRHPDRTRKQCRKRDRSAGGGIGTKLANGDGNSDTRGRSDHDAERSRPKTAAQSNSGQCPKQ